MSMTDPIADMLTRIRNGIQSRHDRVEMPSSKLKVEVAKILKSEGFISNYKVVAAEDGKPQATLRVYLKYSENGEPVIHGIERVSRPGRRVYRGKEEHPEGSRRSRPGHRLDLEGRALGRRGRAYRRRRRSALPGLVRRSNTCLVSERKRFRCRKASRSARTATPSWSRDRKARCSTPIIAGITMSVENNVVKFERPDEEGKTRAFHGLMRALVANNVKGVSEGFKRELDIVGVGYRAEVKGKEVVFQLGYSHPVRFADPRRDRDHRRRQDRPHHHHRHRPPESRPDRGRDPQPARAGPLQGQGHQVLG